MSVEAVAVKCAARNPTGCFMPALKQESPMPWAVTMGTTLPERGLGVVSAAGQLTMAARGESRSFWANSAGSFAAFCCNAVIISDVRDADARAAHAAIVRIKSFIVLVLGVKEGMSNSVLR